MKVPENEEPLWLLGTVFFLHLGDLHCFSISASLTAEWHMDFKTSNEEVGQIQHFFSFFVFLTSDICDLVPAATGRMQHAKLPLTQN